MTTFRSVVAVALLLAPPLSQGRTSLTIEIDGRSRTMTEAELDRLPQDTVRARAHDGPQQTFVGPALFAVLKDAGARLDTLRGRALAEYVIVEAADHYRVSFGIAELSPEFRKERVILAHSVDGHPISGADGPWRVIVEGELRPARWVREVTAIRLRSSPE